MPKHKMANIRWDRENYIFPKVSNMGSIIGHRIDYIKWDRGAK